MRRWAALTALSLLAVAQTVIGLKLAAGTNPDTDQFDQGAYMAMAVKMEGQVYPAMTDGTRNPLFPWITARISDPAGAEFFAAGKRLNIFFAAAGAFLIGVGALTRLGGLAAWNLSALAGLGCLIPIGTFFGAEVLFYLFFFGLWVAGFAFLREPGWRVAVLAGLAAGLAYLAKPSTSPFLGLLTLAVMGTAVLVVAGRRRWDWVASAGWSVKRAAAGLMILFIVFAVVTGPRLAYSAKTFGSPFYSLPSFWFWADSWEDCVNKYASCTPSALARMPAEERPTAANFFRRHDLGHAFQRGLSGTWIKLQQLFEPDRKPFWKSEKKGKPRSFVFPMRGDVLAGLGLLAVVLAALGKFEVLQRPGFLPAGALVAAAFGLYAGAYGWYHVIGPGFRFIMMFYIPLLWSFLCTARDAAETRNVPVVGYTAANVLLAGVVVWRLGVLLSDGGFQKVAYAF